MKLILFDWGGVIENHYIEPNTWYNALYNAIKKVSPIKNNKEILYRFTKVSTNVFGKNLMACSDEIEYVEWYKNLQRELKFEMDYNSFLNILDEEFDKVMYFKNVVDYIYTLKSICKIGILSNLTVFEKSRLDKQVNLSNFDYTFLSYEIGEVKPNLKIFDYVLKKTNLNPADILFIDDKEDNVKNAKQIGFKTLHITGDKLDTIKEEIDKFLNS